MLVIFSEVDFAVELTPHQGMTAKDSVELSRSPDCSAGFSHRFSQLPISIGPSHYVEPAATVETSRCICQPSSVVRHALE